jgi:hypothetical protein
MALMYYVHGMKIFWKGGAVEYFSKFVPLYYQMKRGKPMTLLSHDTSQNLLNANSDAFTLS